LSAEEEKKKDCCDVFLVVADLHRLQLPGPIAESLVLAGLAVSFALNEGAESLCFGLCT
jgi:hypothetical protein